MEITKALLTNYLPYAKGTIIGRAIPSIDGLKPAQRKILYTMYLMKLLNGDKTKSTNIVGQTMKLHPHGDQTIYDTLVRMASGNESLNTPYIESKGNFGKVYSKDLAYAASRYTEAKLASICDEMFDGIDEDAVDFINNYDDSTLEPTLLPVKFPTVLVNPSSGIAVGLSSSIPSFGLENVCNSVIGILNGTITDTSSLVDVLGIPQFTTGGNVHTTKDGIVKLAETGHGSIVMSGTVVTYPDRIVITEIPYKTTAESILDAVENYAKSGELKEVANVSDEIDLSGFKLVIMLKRGSNSQAVLKKLYRLTPLRTQIGFNTRVIIADRCEKMGFYELLKNWIEFRVQCINRIYNSKLRKALEKEYMLSSWEKIKLNIKDVANLIANKSESEARISLMNGYGLDEEQAEYILDMRIREFTQDRLNKHLKELENVRNEINDYKKVINSEEEKYKIIISDQKRIISKYSKGNLTRIMPPIVDEEDKEEEEQVDDSYVSVILTKNGYLKRLINMRDMTSYEVPDDDKEEKRFNVKNNSNLLVFTYDGTVYKIFVNSIDASRGKLKDKITEIIGVDKKQIMFIDDAGDYTKHFNIVYPNGRGARVNYNRANGNRAKYKGLFEESQSEKIWWTFSDKFFMVTKKRKAAYVDLELLGMYNSRTAFKVARVNSDDEIFALQDEKDVPDIKYIDIAKYNKDYTVKIGEDELWKGAREQYRKAMGYNTEN